MRKNTEPSLAKRIVGSFLKMSSDLQNGYAAERVEPAGEAGFTDPVEDDDSLDEVSASEVRDAESAQQSDPLQDPEANALSMQVLGIPLKDIPKDTENIRRAVDAVKKGDTLPLSPVSQIFNLLSPEQRAALYKAAGAGADRVRSRLAALEDEENPEYTGDVLEEPDDEEGERSPGSAPGREEDPEEDTEVDAEEIGEALEKMLPAGKIAEQLSMMTQSLASHLRGFIDTDDDPVELEVRIGENLEQIQKIMNTDPAFRFVDQGEKDLFLESFLGYVQDIVSHKSHSGIIRTYLDALMSTSVTAEEILRYRDDANRTKAFVSFQIDDRHVSDLRGLKRSESQALRSLPQEEYDSLVEMAKKEGLEDTFLASEDDFKGLKRHEVIDNLYKAISQYTYIWIETESAVGQQVTNRPQFTYLAKIVGADGPSPVMRNLSQRLPKGSDGLNVFQRSILGHRFVIKSGAEVEGEDGSFSSKAYPLLPGAKYKLKKSRFSVTNANQQSMAYAIVDAQGDNALFAGNDTDGPEGRSPKLSISDFPKAGHMASGLDMKDKVGYLRGGFLRFCWELWSKQAKKSVESLKQLKDRLYDIAGQSDNYAKEVGDAISASSRMIQKTPPKDAEEYIDMLESIVPESMRKQSKEDFLKSDVFDHRRFYTPIHLDEAFDKGNMLQNLVLQYMIFRAMDDEETRDLHSAVKKAVSQPQMVNILSLPEDEMMEELQRREELQTRFEEADAAVRIAPEIRKYKRIVDAVTRGLPRMKEVAPELVEEGEKGALVRVNAQKAVMTKEFMTGLFSRILSFNNPINPNLLMPMIIAEADSIVEENPSIKRELLKASKKSAIVDAVRKTFTSSGISDDLAIVLRDIKEGSIGDMDADDMKSRYIKASAGLGDFVEAEKEKIAKMVERRKFKSDKLDPDFFEDFDESDPGDAMQLNRAIEHELEKSSQRYMAQALSHETKYSVEKAGADIRESLDPEDLENSISLFSAEAMTKDKGYDKLVKYLGHAVLERSEDDKEPHKTLDSLVKTHATPQDTEVRHLSSDLYRADGTKLVPGDNVRGIDLFDEDGNKLELSDSQLSQIIVGADLYDKDGNKLEPGSNIVGVSVYGPEKKDPSVTNLYANIRARMPLYRKFDPAVDSSEGGVKPKYVKLVPGDSIKGVKVFELSSDNKMEPVKLSKASVDFVTDGNGGLLPPDKIEEKKRAASDKYWKSLEDKSGKLADKDVLKKRLDRVIEEYWKGFAGSASKSGNGILHGLDQGVVDSIKDRVSKELLSSAGDDPRVSRHLADARKKAMAKIKGQLISSGTIEKAVRYREKDKLTESVKKESPRLSDKSVANKVEELLKKEIDKRVELEAKRQLDTEPDIRMSVEEEAKGSLSADVLESVKTLSSSLGGAEAYIKKNLQRYYRDRNAALRDHARLSLNEHSFKLSAIEEELEEIGLVVQEYRGSGESAPKVLLERQATLEEDKSAAEEQVKEAVKALREMTDKKSTEAMISKRSSEIVEESLYDLGVRKGSDLEKVIPRLLTERGYRDFVQRVSDNLDEEITTDMEWSEREEERLKLGSIVEQVKFAESMRKNLDRVRAVYDFVTRRGSGEKVTLKDSKKAIEEEREQQIKELESKGLSQEQAVASLMFDSYAKHMRNVSSRENSYRPKALRNLDRFLKLDLKSDPPSIEVNKKLEKGALSRAVSLFDVEALEDLVSRIEGRAKRGSEEAKRAVPAMQHIKETIKEATEGDIKLSDMLGDSLSAVPKMLQNYLMKTVGSDLEAEAKSRIQGQEMIDNGKLPKAIKGDIARRFQDDTRAQIRRSTIEKLAETLLVIFRDKKSQFRSLDDLLGEVSKSWSRDSQRELDGKDKEMARELAKKVEKGTNLIN